MWSCIYFMHLQIEDIEGEPRVVDIALGAALGYERPRDIRKLIDRFNKQLGELGVLRQRGANTPDPEGRGRPTQENLLNLAQINYLIIRCGLPRADEWCVQIARVFTDGRWESCFSPESRTDQLTENGTCENLCRAKKAREYRGKSRLSAAKLHFLLTQLPVGR